MNRRGFLKGLAATAAGLLVPGDVAAEPERKVWALDSTHLDPKDYTWNEFGWHYTPGGESPFGDAVVDFSHVGGPLNLHTDRLHPSIWQLAVDDASRIAPGPIVIDNEWMHVVSTNKRGNTIAVVRRVDSPLDLVGR